MRVATLTQGLKSFRRSLLNCGCSGLGKPVEQPYTGMLTQAYNPHCFSHPPTKLLPLAWEREAFRLGILSDACVTIRKKRHEGFLPDNRVKE